MKLTKVAVAVVASAVSFGALAQKGPKPQAPTPLIVVDAAGKTVGQFYGAVGVAPYVVAMLNRQPVAISLTPDSIDTSKVIPGNTGIVYFSSAGCTGNAYIAQTSKYGFKSDNVFTVNGEHILYMSSIGVITSNAVSSSHSGASCTTFLHPAEMNLVPVDLTIINLTAAFPPPWSVR
jgi:hypothetical protein